MKKIFSCTLTVIYSLSSENIFFQLDEWVQVLTYKRISNESTCCND